MAPGSPVSYVHATVSCFTLSRLICFRAEYRFCSGPPPYPHVSVVAEGRADWWAIGTLPPTRPQPSNSESQYARVVRFIQVCLEAVSKLNCDAGERARE